MLEARVLSSMVDKASYDGGLIFTSLIPRLPAWLEVLFALLKAHSIAILSDFC